jgi:NADH dehydrogenase
VVPLRRVLRRCQVLSGRISRIDHARRTARFRPLEGPERDLAYDVLVLAPGSIARTLPIPGLAEQGIGFKQVEEAIALRNQVLEKLDIATTITDHAARRKLLTFVFVGGGYSGIEALAELEDMARSATQYYQNITPADMRWVLVEATGRILPEVGEDMGRYTLEQLGRRGMDLRLETRLESAEGGVIKLSDGDEFPSNTLVWTAGVKPHPILAATGLPLDERGRVKATTHLRVEGLPDVWTAGDCAAVPDLTKEPGQTTGPSAQHAVRQAKHLGGNIVSALRGFQTRPYEHKYAGSVAGLGLHKGVAQVYGVKLRGWPAWFMHRTYHVSRVPTFNRKARVVADWTLSLFFRREIISLGSLAQPQREFTTYAVRPKPAGQQQEVAR